MEIARIKDCLSMGIPLDILLLTPDECVSNFRNHNPLFLDIAWEGIVLVDSHQFLKSLIDETRRYIEEKGIKMLPDGWKFPVAYRRATNLSRVSNRAFATAMLTDAERDYEIGIILVREQYFDKAIYHFQQSVEKSLKAILICFGEFKKTHFISGVLADTLNDTGIGPEWQEKLSHIAHISQAIEPEFTWSRYPGVEHGKLWLPYQEYDQEDALSIQEKSTEVVNIARQFVSWWFEGHE